MEYPLHHHAKGLVQYITTERRKQTKSIEIHTKLGPIVNYHATEANFDQGGLILDDGN